MAGLDAKFGILPTGVRSMPAVSVVGNPNNVTGNSEAVPIEDLPDLMGLGSAATAAAGDFAPAVHSHSASAITSGVIAPERLGSGTPSSTKYLRGDGWNEVPQADPAGPTNSILRKGPDGKAFGSQAFDFDEATKTFTIRNSDGSLFLKIGPDPFDPTRPCITFANTNTDTGLAIRNHAGSEVARFQDNLYTVIQNLATGDLVFQSVSIQRGSAGKLTFAEGDADGAIIDISTLAAGAAYGRALRVRTTGIPGSVGFDIKLDEAQTAKAFRVVKSDNSEVTGVSKDGDIATGGEIRLGATKGARFPSPSDPTNRDDDIKVYSSARGFLTISLGDYGARSAALLVQDFQCRNAFVDSAVIASGPIKAGVYTVATLPDVAANAYYRAAVSDSSVAAAGNYGATVVGGGSHKVSVFSNGTAWVIA